MAQASAAAAEASSLLSESRGTLVTEKEYVPEKNVNYEGPRIGAFICHCGINIGGVVDVPAVVEYARTLPYVVYVTDNIYTCSQDTQDTIKKAIEEHRLNRIFVASCTPRTHEPLFQDTIRQAGLNRYLFEMANIRDQCSWVHMHQPREATEKAKDLVRMAIAKTALLEPLPTQTGRDDPEGPGHRGRFCGDDGSPEDRPGRLRRHSGRERERTGRKGQRDLSHARRAGCPDLSEELIGEVEKHPRIQLLKGTTIEKIDGFVGNFKTEVKTGDDVKDSPMGHYRCHRSRGISTRGVSLWPG